MEGLLSTPALISDPEYCRRVLTFVGAARKSRSLTEGALVAEWRAVDATKAASERPIQAETLRLFEEQKRDVVRRLSELAAAGALPSLRGFAPGTTTKDPLIVRQIFDLARWGLDVVRRLAPRLLSVLEGGFETGMRRLAVSGADFTSSSPRVAQTLRALLQEAPRINDTTAEILVRTIQEGLTAGEDWEAMGRRVETAFDDFKGYRARLTARTLGTTAFEAGQLEAFEEAGVGRKRWLSQRDGRVRIATSGSRFDHRAPDGQERSIDEPFEVSGELLQHPGDPAASLGNRANCRCTSLPILS